ncbi:glycine-rich cell wall structural protein-like [Trifolium pratense]|uniref:glycine-rich cell wall structural protein-like n=1 Tax=Trifolium pratense TaxID=57577 RepID=UPI001E69768E|nr:glycine-rich cell wall structural protein-like [Trifolium pratense]
MSYKKMNSKGVFFLAMLLAFMVLISAEKSDKKDDKANGIDENKFGYYGGWGYGGPWRGGWRYGGPWRGGYGWGGPWRGGGWGGGYGGWGGGWPKGHNDANINAEPEN